MSSLHWWRKMRMPASSGERKNPAVEALLLTRQDSAAAGSVPARSRCAGTFVSLERTARFGRRVEDAFRFFGFPAPNRALRATENPRVDGSISSLTTTS
jgi:hypothetical protein